MARKPRKSIPLSPQLENDVRILCSFTGQKETEVCIQAIIEYVEEKLTHYLKQQQRKKLLGLVEEA
jgi:hypothetical protein